MYKAIEDKHLKSMYGDIAKELELDRSYIFRIVNGKQLCRKHLAFSISAIMNKELDELFTREK